MFKRILPIKNPVRIRFENKGIDAESSDTVAAALLGSGIIEFRQSAETKKSAGPYCMIGNCFECLVEIDGIPNLRACQVPVSQGMQVKIQRGLTRIEVDSES